MTSRFVTLRARHFLADQLTVDSQPDVWLLNAKVVDDTGASLFDPVTGGLKVTVVSGGGGGGDVPADVNVTDRIGRVLGRVGVDLLTDAIGIATDAGLTSVYTRLADGSVRVGGTVAVSAVALPLPAGAATQATLATLATDAGLASVYARLGDGSQHVAVDSLPSGLATSAKQDTGNASLASLDGKVTACDTAHVAGTVAVSNFPASQAVTGTFFQATQPVSAAALPLPSGASTEATLALIKAKTDNLDVALSTRAVTGLTDTQLRASAVPISAASLPLPAGAAQEHTTAASPHACRLSDGAAFIDPRSIRALTSGDQVTIANASLAVTGTFWQATQPVSLAALPALVAGSATIGKVDQGAAGAAAWKVDGSAVTQPVSGTFWQATQPVSAASLPLPTGAATESTLSTLNGKVTACNTGAVVVSAITPPTLTKGTQGATGFSTQDLKDAGRARVSIVFQGTGAVSDALLSLVKSTNGVAAGGATTIAVAANKRLRITSMTFSVKANAAAAAFATFTLRINPAGAAVITSQIELRVDLGNTEAVVGAARAISIPLPDGFELTGTDQLAVSALAQATTNILSVSLNGFEY